MNKSDFLYYHGVGNAAKELCKEALCNQLFVENWELVNNLIDCIESKSVKFYGKRRYYITSGVRYKDKLVGICLIRGNWILMFIKPKYRRLGLGKELMDVLIDVYDIDQFKLIAGSGRKGSKEFWSNYPFIKTY